jgi:predicted nucleic acid-binding protein
MTFDDFPAGAAIFLDANTLIYHFSNHPRYGPACTGLMERIEQHGLTNLASLDDDFERVPGLTRYAPV